MKTVDFFKGDNKEIVVALGFFDSIHVGHTKIIKKAQQIANELGVSSAVFTFENDIDSFFGVNTGLVLTYDERLKKLEKLSINTVISTIFTKEFSSITANDFFKMLTSNFSVKAIVCGRDYCFGYKGLGNVDLLKQLCNDKGIYLHVIDDVAKDGRRVSTTHVKQLLLNGNIEVANQLLGESYSICGEVVHGRAIGAKMGFPTANVVIPKEKARIKVGVYKTRVVLDGKSYNAITNYGARPTFNLDEVLTETYIDGYKGDLYGKEITVYFEEFLRECVKFSSIEELTLQLQRDLESIR